MTLYGFMSTPTTVSAQINCKDIHHPWGKPGYLVGKSDRLMIKRLPVWIPAGAEGEFSTPELTFCADSYSVSVSPPVAHKRPRSLCQKCRWQVTPKHAYTFDPTKSEWGWLCHCPGIVWEPIRKRAHMQLIREHSVIVVSACWATVDWSWPKE